MEQCILNITPPADRASRIHSAVRQTDRIAWIILTKMNRPKRLLQLSLKAKWLDYTFKDIWKGLETFSFQLLKKITWKSTADKLKIWNIKRSMKNKKWRLNNFQSKGKIFLNVVLQKHVKLLFFFLRNVLFVFTVHCVHEGPRTWLVTLKMLSGDGKSSYFKPN